MAPDRPNIYSSGNSNGTLLGLSGLVKTEDSKLGWCGIVDGSGENEEGEYYKSTAYEILRKF